MLFDNLSAATGYLLLAMAHLSSLAKICNEKTFGMILAASARPLVQVNIPENFLNQVADKQPPSNGEAHMKKLWGALLLNDRCAVLSQE